MLSKRKINTVECKRPLMSGSPNIPHKTVYFIPNINTFLPKMLILTSSNYKYL